MVEALTGLTGAVVVLLAVWLGQSLATRRERWNLKRDLYTRLLENLGEAKDAIRLLLPLAHMGRTGPGVEERQWDMEVSRLQDRRSQALDEVRRAASVSAIILRDEALKALQELQREHAEAGRLECWFQLLIAHHQAVIQAYDLLLTAAKKDLGSNRWFRTSRRQP